MTTKQSAPPDVFAYAGGYDEESGRWRREGREDPVHRPAGVLQATIEITVDKIPPGGI